MWWYKLSYFSWQQLLAFMVLFGILWLFIWACNGLAEERRGNDAQYKKDHLSIDNEIVLKIRKGTPKEVEWFNSTQSSLQYENIFRVETLNGSARFYTPHIKLYQLLTYASKDEVND